ncbi:MAG: ribonuclease HII [candidate division WOR-3 bacterium]
MIGKIDQELWQKGIIFCGIDEVGRGALAGPVIACALILPPNSFFVNLRDSKKLSPQRREYFYKVIKKQALAIGIGKASPQEIDRFNIRNATLLAMKRAARKVLKKYPECKLALVDGSVAPKLKIESWPIIKGDEKSTSIACASIIAKVVRDRLMKRLAQYYPEYQFSIHKGYPTSRHRELLVKFGPSKIHRQSFTLVK